MAYIIYLNNNLFFDSSLQTDEITLTRATVKISANGSGSFDFVIPPQHKDYNNLHRLTDFIDIYRDDELLWSGRIYSITDQYDSQKAVSCEGLLSVLADTIYRPETFQGELFNLICEILYNHNSQVENAKKIQVGSFTVDNANVYRDYINYETSISRLKDLWDSFGGYMSIRRSNGQLYFDWVDHFTEPCTQRIDISSNLVDIKKTIDSAGIFTMLIPLGAKGEDDKRLTIESVNSGLDYITASSSAIAEHGYIMQTQIWDDVNSAALLKSKAITYMQAALAPKYEITLKAIDLADAGYEVDSFRVGQMITVYSQPHGIEGLQFACQEQTLNLLDPSQNRLSLGEVRVGFVESQRSMSANQILEKTAQDIERSREALEQEIASATATITGNAGGYVVMHDSDDDTLPDEILVMDTPDIDTAVKVWRWNKAGFGYSNTGYNGTFGTAITMTGHVVADYVDTGIIRGGNSYWNLDTGEMVISGYATESALNNVKSIAESKVITFYQTSTPTAMATGDLWIDTDDDNKLYRWNGSSWVNVQDGKIQSALSAAADAQSTADSKIVTYAQASQPSSTGLDTGDLWVDTDDNNHMYRWDGLSWVSMRDATIATAQSTANNSLSSAVPVYYRSTTQSTPTINSQTSIGTSDDTSNAWEYVVPKPKSDCYFYTCTKYTKSGGTVSFSDVRKMSDVTAVSAWCNSNDSTYIDGSHIYAGTVTADKISVADLYALGATIGGWTINSNSLSSQINDSEYVTKLQVPTSSNTYVVYVTHTETLSGGGQQITYPFYLTASGYLKAENCNINGTVNTDNFNATGSFIVNTDETASPSSIKLNSLAGTSTRYHMEIFAGELRITNPTSSIYMNGYGISVTRSNNVPWSLTDDNGNGYLYMHNSSGTTTISIKGRDGTIKTTGTITPSDRRLKDDIQLLDNAKSAEFIHNMKPSSFKMRINPYGHHHGFIAQDIEELLMRVYGDNDWQVVCQPDPEEEHDIPYKTLAYMELLADVVATIQTHNDRITALENA